MDGFDATRRRGEILAQIKPLAVNIVLADTGFVPNVVPRKIEDMLKAHEAAAWEQQM